MRHALYLLAAAVWGNVAVAQSSPLTIETDAAVHAFEVELADEPDEITRGLMDRTDLARDAGMIFDFGDVREANMWMKDTPLSLDMLFIAEDGEILAIARDTVPFSTRIINPGVPVKSVLELNAGVTAELDIGPGDNVRFEIFENVADAE